MAYHEEGGIEHTAHSLLLFVAKTMLNNPTIGTYEDPREVFFGMNPPCSRCPASLFANVLSALEHGAYLRRILSMQNCFKSASEAQRQGEAVEILATSLTAFLDLLKTRCSSNIIHSCPQ
jgi:hypothetical protein